MTFYTTAEDVLKDKTFLEHIESGAAPLEFDPETVFCPIERDCPDYCRRKLSHKEKLLHRYKKLVNENLIDQFCSFESRSSITQKITTWVYQSLKNEVEAMRLALLSLEVGQQELRDLQTAFMF